MGEKGWDFIIIAQEKSKSQGENSRNEGVSPKMIEEEVENRK